MDARCVSPGNDEMIVSCEHLLRQAKTTFSILKAANATYQEPQNNHFKALIVIISTTETKKKKFYLNGLAQDLRRRGNLTTKWLLYMDATFNDHILGSLTSSGLSFGHGFIVVLGLFELVKVLWDNID